MKSHLRALSLMLSISFALVWHVLPVYASPHYDLAPNPFAEAYLLENLRLNGDADFEMFPEAERNISGKALIDALKDSQVQTHSFLYIANVTVVDGIYANDSVIPVNVQFENVNFSGDVDLNSSLLHAVWIDNSTFQSYLNFNLATFDGNVGMQGNTFEQVSFGRAMINGGVDLRNNTFNTGVD
ncbi:MAG TPA: pentapeptide repeat-containing protein, partial [Anaerolineales bacterium]|nr:pentapeptide repeat-containing protein [Anaerolineales bacterium]